MKWQFRNYMFFQRKVTNFSIYQVFLNSVVKNKKFKIVADIIRSSHLGSNMTSNWLCLRYVFTGFSFNNTRSFTAVMDFEFGPSWYSCGYILFKAVLPNEIVELSIVIERNIWALKLYGTSCRSEILAYCTFKCIYWKIRDVMTWTFAVLLVWQTCDPFISFYVFFRPHRIISLPATSTCKLEEYYTLR